MTDRPLSATGWQVYASAIGGDSWPVIARASRRLSPSRLQTLYGPRLHLRALAHVGPELTLDVGGPATRRSVLDPPDAPLPVVGAIAGG